MRFQLLLITFIRGRMVASSRFNLTPYSPQSASSLFCRVDTANQPDETYLAKENNTDHDITRIDSEMVVPDVSRLLSLPKELRLEIWGYVLLYHSKERPVLWITRRLEGANTSDKRFQNSLYKHTSCPEIRARFGGGIDYSIGASLLRTNRLIYTEALPILYHSITFFPYDIQGIFALFIERLSTFARSHIRYIRLPTRHVFGRPAAYFYWALTCAQVAKLSDSLHLVELDGSNDIFSGILYEKRAILNPLLKVKAPLCLLTGCDSLFKEALATAAVEMEARADSRAALTMKDGAERRGIADPEQISADRSRKRPYLHDLPIRTAQKGTSARTADEREAAHALSTMPDMKQRDRNELREWDMLSILSTTSSLSVCSTSIDNEDYSVHSSSPVIDKIGGAINGDEDDWEFIDKDI